jgi:6,7-dimethyl-8-ribityllumazine synthase
MQGRLAIRRGKASALSIVALAAAILLVSCGTPAPHDPYCSIAPLPGGIDVKAGQGALQVEATTSAYFYVLDPAGKSVNHQTLGKTLALESGKYQLKVNNSAHPVAVERGKLTSCSTGTLLTSGTTTEYWYVQDTTGKALQHDTLGKAISLMPGTFRVKVNNTEVPAEVKPGQTTEIKTGTLVVRGETNEYYYAADTLGKPLNHNTLEKPLAFLPGSYAVKVNNTEAKADVVAGQVTELKTGTLIVKGLTDEYYYVTDSAGKALSHQSINKTLAFLPGNYRVLVNKTEKTVDIPAAQTVEAQTGSLVVEGTGSDYYYVSDKTGNALSHNSLNKALSFFPAEYNVKLGETTRSASVEAGQTTRVKHSL